MALITGSILSGLVYAYSLVSREDEAFSHCLSLVWMAQTEQKKILEKLLSLNTRVRTLQLAEKKAQAKLAAAMSTGTPPAIAAAQAHLQAVRFQMQILDSEQKALLVLAEKVGADFQSRIHSRLKKLKVEKISIQPLSLAVQASPPGQIAPYYYPHEPMIRNQEAGAKWKIQHLSGSCFASLEQRQGQWHVTLTGGKPL